MGNRKPRRQHYGKEEMKEDILGVNLYSLCRIQKLVSASHTILLLKSIKSQRMFKLYMKIRDICSLAGQVSEHIAVFRSPIHLEFRPITTKPRIYATSFLARLFLPALHIGPSRSFAVGAEPICRACDISPTAHVSISCRLKHP